MMQALYWSTAASLVMAACVFADLFRVRFHFRLEWPAGEWISGFFIREFHISFGPLYYHVCLSDIGDNHQQSRTLRFDPIFEERKRPWSRADAPVGTAITEGEWKWVTIMQPTTQRRLRTAHP